VGEDWGGTIRGGLLGQAASSVAADRPAGAAKRLTCPAVACKEPCLAIVCQDSTSVPRMFNNRRVLPPVYGSSALRRWRDFRPTDEIFCPLAYGRSVGCRIPPPWSCSFRAERVGDRGLAAPGGVRWRSLECGGGSWLGGASK